MEIFKINFILNSQITIREIAIFLWIAVFFLVVLLISSNFRDDVYRYIKQRLLVKSSIIFILFVTIYALVLGGILYLMNFQDIGLINSTIIWYFLVMYFYLEIISDEKINNIYFKKVLKENIISLLIWSLVIQFILNYFLFFLDRGVISTLFNINILYCFFLFCQRRCRLSNDSGCSLCPYVYICFDKLR